MMLLHIYYINEVKYFILIIRINILLYLLFYIFYFNKELKYFINGLNILLY